MHLLDAGDDDGDGDDDVDDEGSIYARDEMTHLSAIRISTIAK